MSYAGIFIYGYYFHDFLHLSVDWLLLLQTMMKPLRYLVWSVFDFQFSMNGFDSDLMVVCRVGKEPPVELAGHLLVSVLSRK